MRGVRRGREGRRGGEAMRGGERRRLVSKPKFSSRSSVSLLASPLPSPGHLLTLRSPSAATCRLLQLLPQQPRPPQQISLPPAHLLDGSRPLPVPALPSARAQQEGAGGSPAQRSLPLLVGKELHCSVCRKLAVVPQRLDCESWREEEEGGGGGGRGGAPAFRHRGGSEAIAPVLQPACA
eukprot:768707-Hanusia_phi.AAC.8